MISKGIVTTEDVDEIKSKPRQVHQFLKYIEGPLSANNAENFYNTSLDVIMTNGNISTKS